MTYFQFPYDPDPTINLTRNLRPHSDGCGLMASANILESAATATPPTIVHSTARDETGPMICGFSGDSPRLL